MIYQYGIVRCEKKQFTDIQPEDYIISRKTNVSIECLVRDKEATRRKYKNVVVDSASLEEIMLFYIKGGLAEMKGLVYKEFSLFYKSIDKKLIIIAAAAIILLLMNAGDFSGLLATIMFAMTVGMQNVMSFASDEQVRWKNISLLCL